MVNYFAAMTNRELLCFVNKFRQLLSDGNTAKLVMDCESGCARVNLEVLFQPAHHPHPQEQQKPHHQVHRRAACPARQRRRVRRAQAREADNQADKEQGRLNVSKAPPDPVHEAAHPQPPDTVEQATHHQPPDTVEQAAHHQPPDTVEQAAHQQPPHTVEQAAHYQPPHTVEEPVHYHPLQTVEEPVHYHPLQTVEEPVNHKPPNPVPHVAREVVNHFDVISPFGRAAEGFPPLSYTPKEVFLQPAAAPDQVFPVWPAHYHGDDQALSPSPSWPGHCHPQSPPRSPSSAGWTPSGPQSSDQKKGKQKSKKKRRKRGQLDDCLEAPESMDPAAVAKYKADCEAYLMREYGVHYHQAKAEGLIM